MSKDLEHEEMPEGAQQFYNGQWVKFARGKVFAHRGGEWRLSTITKKEILTGGRKIPYRVIGNKGGSYNG